jgi:membrane fusion protein (multidrug efflux system)
MTLKLSTAIFLIFLVFISACTNKRAQEMPPPELPVVDVTVKDVPIYQEYVGQTYGYYDIAIRARVEGFLLDRSIKTTKDEPKTIKPTVQKKND